MAGYDMARFALEAATNGKNTIILDDAGLPSVMVRIPMFLWSDVIDGAPEEPCPAFVVNGRVLDCIYISKYLNIIENGRAYSLPGRDPANTLSIDTARSACAAKGKGWHLMTNAEWAAVSHWCVKNGKMPRGNSQFGASHEAPWERGVMVQEGTRGKGSECEMRTLTGSGPASWTHDGTDAGITDMNGNIWDMVSGFRVMDGEIQVIPDNNAALNLDESTGSSEWRAIDINGNYVLPGSGNTLYYDSIEEGIAAEDDRLAGGGMILNTKREHPHYFGTQEYTDHCAYGWMEFFKLGSKVEIPGMMKLIELGIAPRSDYRDGASFFLRNYGDRRVARGGSWFDGPGGGLWDLYIRETGAFIFPDIGFRAAYIRID